MRFAALIGLLAVVVRGRAFLISRGDANVDAAFHVAAVWLGGSLPYVSAWEYKPPGLFALDALGLAIFRDAGLAGACFGTLAVVVTALASRSVLRTLLGESETAARIAAVAVVLFSVEDQGVLGDAEVYVNAFIALAFAALGSRRPRLVRIAAAALAAACALQIKLVALPLVALVAFEAAYRCPGARARSLATFTSLALAPFGLEALLYARGDAFAALWDANVGATLRRAFAVGGHVRRDNAGQWFAQLRVLGPAMELALVAAIARDRARYSVLWAWFGIAALTVGVSGEFYDRQFLLLVPPVALLGTVGLTKLANAWRAERVVIAVALLITLGLHDYYEVAQSVRILAHRAAGDSNWRAGHFALVRDALHAQLGGDRSLYVVQDSPMLYDALGANAPTRFAFSGNLLEPAMWPMLGFRGRDELARVLAARPHVIAAGRLDGALDPASTALLKTVLKTDYRVAGVADGTTIYALRSRARTGLEPS
ncbi:MAG: hypothetical protein M3R53_08495 [Candidatus Eremiobacteraeota bacterium]|nr:hypothetical protein [Candidatus Eremiobacteraeota bacterium]